MSDVALYRVGVLQAAFYEVRNANTVGRLHVIRGNAILSHPCMDNRDVMRTVFGISGHHNVTRPETFEEARAHWAGQIVAKLAEITAVERQRVDQFVA